MEQNHLFENTCCLQLDMPDADITYLPNWLNCDYADNAFLELQRTAQWRQDTIKLFGKEHLIPRLHAWYGDPDINYAYSGLTLTTQPWLPLLVDLKRKCEQVASTRFNSVLLNWYRDGQDSMGMHSDNEPELGENPIIASISLGATRTLTFKHKVTNATHPVKLAPGSLLIMSGNTQYYWLHGINKSKRIDHGRINLTFRYVHQMK